MDASNLLKPALARGELHCIGATTLNEYRKHIEKDAALERRFQPVLVDQPSVEETISILRGLRERYELHHGVRIKDAALVTAAVLSDRYISDRFLPDKAIDLVDEAAAKLRTEIDSLPAELDEVSRRSCSSDRAQGAPQGDQSCVATASKLEKGSPTCAAKATACVPVESERAASPSTANCAEIEQARLEIEKAERAYDLSKVAGSSTGSLASSAELARRKEPRAGERPAVVPAPPEEVDEGHRRGGGGALDPHSGLKLMQGRSSCSVSKPICTARRRPGRAVSAVADAVVRALGPQGSTVRSGRSSSSARRASGRPISPGRSPSSCSTTSTR